MTDQDKTPTDVHKASEVLMRFAGRPINDALFADVTRAIGAEAGAFVRCRRSNNPEHLTADGELKAEVFGSDGHHYVLRLQGEAV